MRVVMMGLWPHEDRIDGGVLNSTMYQVRELGKSREPEMYFISFSPIHGTLSEGNAKIVLIKRRRVFYALPFLAVVSVCLAARKLKPDVIHVRGGNLSPYLVYALFFARTKKIVTYGSCRSKELVASGLIKRRSLHHAVLRWLERQTARRADLIIALTSRLAAQIGLLDKSARGKTIVVPNGVDPDVFSPTVTGDYAREQLGLSKTDFLIFHAKAFEPFNGQLCLIRALPEVLDKIPNAKLVLAGVGPLSQEAHTLSAQLALSEKVRFPGHVPHDQIPSYLAAADVVVVPSIRMGTMEEGSSNLLVEAMATQKPIVATDVGGNRDSITHEENGLLVRERDPHAIAEAVLKIYHDRALAAKLGRNAREYVMRERTWENNARRIRAAYERTLRE